MQTRSHSSSLSVVEPIYAAALVPNEKENDPIICRIKEKFGSNYVQQEIFIQSFQLFIKYQKDDGFVIDFDDVYEWMGFTRKDNAKRKLESSLEENVDYILILRSEGCSTDRTIKIMIKLKSFKDFCMAAQTAKAKEIRKYFITIEEIVFEHLQEDVINKEKMSRSITLIEIYAHKRIVYLGFVAQMQNYFIIKYGCTIDIEDTLKRHRLTYGNRFYFMYMIECAKHDELEDKIQTHSDLVSRHVRKYEGFARKELLRIDDIFNLEKLINLIKMLKTSIEINTYSVELEMEKEKTKQVQVQIQGEQEKTKQMEIQEKTKIELKKLELEFKKLELEVTKNSIQMDNAENINASELVKLPTQTSIYTGVVFLKEKNIYRAAICYKTKTQQLGWGTEDECAILYNKQALYYNNNFGAKYKLNVIPNHENALTQEEDVYGKKNQCWKNNKISSYIGVTKHGNGYRAYISLENIKKHLGTYKKELEAAKAYNEKAIELNKTKKKKLYKINEIF